ncbi:glutamine synthetase family protein [Tengunoibacter tsumagoiensis]|uniref:Glutamine synthetase n=1 Tax=Tengunoibacter tsumagoiensis TaxID=2014871 RepID=A0A402A3K9_9CHLR|nr:glutamine synthetase family protein [Tengunoibacter tsumagoiensis]GCE13733.1 glutamine synthetase [Tengunoibacter tsumagoiensis]
MDFAEVKSLIEERKVEYIKIGVPDMEGVFRGKRVAARFFLDSLSDGFAQSDVLFGWDIAENVLPNLKISNWERGFGDFVMVPDLTTFAVVPWEQNVATCICDLWTEQGQPIHIAPRSVLQTLVERARSLGYEPMAASELEMRFFRENQVTLRDKDFGPDLTPLNPGTNCYVISHASADEHLIGTIARNMRDYGVELEGYNREHGPGMYELNMRYTDALTAADRTLLFKNGTKELCHQGGYTVSFMAKWNDQEDGSSGHSHLSLWDRTKERNVFWDDAAEGHMSETMRWFLAGVLQKMPELMVLYAPIINSYKRYMEGTWAPLNTSWGMDNRTCAVRVINSGRKAIRIENRVPGSDANFYLVFSAMLASGLYGIEQKLELPPRLDGNAYNPANLARAISAGELHVLPRNLTTATDLFGQSAFAKEYLGADFVEHFVATRRWEVKEFEKAVTNWERRRYLELI